MPKSNWTINSNWTPDDNAECEYCGAQADIAPRWEKGDKLACASCWASCPGCAEVGKKEVSGYCHTCHTTCVTCEQPTETPGDECYKCQKGIPHENP